MSTIGYKPGSSVLHRLDPRTKQILVMVLSTACFIAGTRFLCATAAILCLSFSLSGLRILQTIKETRYFLLFLLFILVVRMIGLDENFLPIVKMDQVHPALLFCLRLLLVMMMGVLLISTTRTTDIRASLIRGLRPLPLVNENRAGTMVGLFVRLLPLVLLQANDIGDAMKARCVEDRKKPVARLTLFTILLFRRTFARADGFVDSMQARCYTENRTLPHLQFTRIDLAAAGIGMLLLLVIFTP